MSFYFNCPVCNMNLEAEDEWENMQSECPGCKNNIIMKKTSPAVKHIPQGAPQGIPQGIPHGFRQGTPQGGQQGAPWGMPKYNNPGSNNQQYNFINGPYYGVPTVNVAIFRDPFFAMLFSLSVVGFGQMYNWQFLKGAVIFIVSVALITIASVMLIIFTESRHPDPSLLVFSGMFYLFWLVWDFIQIVDAVRIARKINSGKQVGVFEWF